MDSLLSEIRERARRGDWDAVLAMSKSLPQQNLPATAQGLRVYLRELEETLITARTSRAHAVESLARLNAAAGFHGSSTGFASLRQEFGETADS